MAAKTTLQRALQNQVQIDFGNEHDICDENGNSFDDYGDENDQKQTNTMGFQSNIPPLGTITW